MYQRFKYYMEKKLLHRIPHKHWEYEASHLQVKKSARGYLMIHHESEDDHDDCMDATAGLIHLVDNPNIIRPSAMYVGAGGASSKNLTSQEESDRIRDDYIARTVLANNSMNKQRTYGGDVIW
jgi:hypothetical protein